MSGAAALRRDRRVAALVAVSHAGSHFYQLALPPLFPLVHATEGIGYASLGALVGVFFAVSAVCQPLAGFLVDRVGARLVLPAGLATMAASTACYGIFPGYPSLLAFSVLAAVGNSVFHPCDYSIMNATIDEGRLGRAFSLHMLGGYLGYAAAPVAVTAAAAALGWRAAAVGAGLVGLLLLAVLLAGGGEFRDSTHERARDRAPEPLGLAAKALMRPALALCWAFFLVVAMAQIGMMTFTPALLKEIHDFDLEAGGAFVSVMVVATACGIACGGALADRVGRAGAVVTTGYLLASASVLSVWGLELEAWQLNCAFAVSGFAYGLVLPSRELIVRAASPKGASGRVFGFVYSGMDMGAAAAPVLFGWLADAGRARTAFLCVALLWLLSAAIILMAGAATRRDAPR